MSDLFLLFYGAACFIGGAGVMWARGYKPTDPVWVELASLTNDRLTLVSLRLDRIEDILAKGENDE